jgi:hypothetical protein
MGQGLPASSGRLLRDTFSEIVHNTLFSKRCVTWRTYGMNGEHRRPMFHRFHCKAPAVTLSSLIAENVSRSNSLYNHLLKKGRIK